MATSVSGPPAERVALYEKIVSLFPDVERKGKAMPYTSVKGHMFSFLDAKGNIGLRLPKDERERFLAKHATELMVAHGVVLKEYVTIPDEVLRRTDEVRTYFAASLAYVSSLKPKATTRQAPKRKKK